jgi:hypothetical protein
MRVLCAGMALFATSLLAAGCGGGGDDGAEPTHTAAVSETPAPEASETPANASAIRAADLEGAAPVQDFADVTGGTFEQANVLYADVTDDGIEEAVVPLSSGGTLGDVGFVVLRLAADDLEAILTVTPQEGDGISVNIGDGTLVAVEPVPGPDDPECCPSQLRTTIYAWDGEALVVESSEVAPATPDAAATPQ